MFFALQADRANIVQALSAETLADRGLTVDEYKTGQTVYFLSLLLAALPSQLIAKRLGIDRWLPLQMICWGVVASMQTGISGRWSFWVARALIGMLEGGLVPSTILYLSYFYTGTELPKRLAWVWVGYPAVTVVSTLLHVAILRSSGLWQIPDWRWLFGIEGTITIVTGCVTWLYLPASPTQTASKLRGKQGWFSVTEEKIMVNRILRDDPGKGDMNYREAVTLKQVWNCLCDYHLWPIYLLGLTWQIPMFPITQWLNDNLRHLGLDTYLIQLLCLPSPAIWIGNLLIFTYISEWLNERFLLSILSQVWVLPLLVTMMCLPNDRDRWHNWVLTMLGCAQPYVHVILIGLASRNAGSVRNRTVSVALYSMCVHASDVIGTNVRITSVGAIAASLILTDIPERRRTILLPGQQDPDHGGHLQHPTFPRRETILCLFQPAA